MSTDNAQGTVIYVAEKVHEESYAPRVYGIYTSQVDAVADLCAVAEKYIRSMAKSDTYNDEEEQRKAMQSYKCDRSAITPIPNMTDAACLAYACALPNALAGENYVLLKVLGMQIIRG